jgi:hypothetical protein
VGKSVVSLRMKSLGKNGEQQKRAEETKRRGLQSQLYPFQKLLENSSGLQ